MPLAHLLKNSAYAALRRFNLLSAPRHPSPNCILVLQYMLPLGGCVHATPLFEVLHQEMPQLPLYVATRGLGIEVLRHNPNVAGLIETPDVFVDLRLAGKALATHLEAAGLRPAWVILDASNPRSKIALLGSIYARAPLAGFSLAAGLQTISLRRNRSLSMIEENLSIAKALGAKAEHREPRVYCGREEADHARTLLAEVNPEAQPVVVISSQPSGGQPTAWREERWAEVFSILGQRRFLPVFVGTANQTEAVDRLRASAPHVRSASLAGKTDVATLAAVLALADLCISIDTGTLHVARASAVPCVALAPSFQRPVEWLPLCVPTARVLRAEHTAPAPPGYRLDEIEVPEVIAAMDDLMAAYPPANHSREERLAAITSEVDHTPAIRSR